MKLTVETLRELMSYDPETGVFRWKVRGRGRRFDEPVGFPNRQGYLRVSIFERRWLMHRLAWLHMTGEWPKDQLDHINGLRADNRWANLREATAAQNRANMRTRSSNRLGIKGVRWRADCHKWEARICKDYKEISIGLYTSPQRAHAAYVVAACQLFGAFARSG